MDRERVKQIAEGACTPCGDEIRCALANDVEQAITLAVNEALEFAAENMCRPYELDCDEWIPRAIAQKRIRALKLPESR